MTTGYWKELEDIRKEEGCEDADFGFMENLTGAAWGDEPWTLKGKEFNAYDFLHGYCDIFAEYLSSTCGYETESVYSDEEGKVLVHSYCVIKREGESDLYVDVRGVCDSRRVLLEEFEDFIEDPENPVIKPGLPERNQDMAEEDFDAIWFFASEMLEITGKSSYRVSTPAAA